MCARVVLSVECVHQVVPDQKIIIIVLLNFEMIFKNLSQIKS